MRKSEFPFHDGFDRRRFGRAKIYHQMAQRLRGFFVRPATRILVGARRLRLGKVSLLKFWRFLHGGLARKLFLAADRLAPPRPWRGRTPFRAHPAATIASTRGTATVVSPRASASTTSFANSSTMRSRVLTRPIVSAFCAPEPVKRIWADHATGFLVSMSRSCCVEPPRLIKTH
jgi:hypothetical protein